MRRGKQTGFTLLEILISISIFGVVMLAILNLQQGTIQTTSNVINASDRLEDQTLATSYVADRFRGAQRVTEPCSSTSSILCSTTPLNLGGTITCSSAPASANPCIAFITSETTQGDATGAITRYVHLAYRYEPRTSFADRQPEPWADTNGVEIIREYRRVLAPVCTSLSTCTDKQLTDAAALTPSATSGLWTSAMLADGFTRANTSGTFSPWTLPSTGSTNPSTTLEIRIRSLYKQSGAAKYFPLSGPTTLQVLRRN